MNAEKIKKVAVFPLITKEKFCAILNNLRDKETAYNEISDKLSDTIGMTVDLVPTVNFVEDIVYLLDVAMGTHLLEDDKKEKEEDGELTFSPIEFFVYELNYGRDCDSDSIRDESDNPIDFSTPEAVYDYIVSTLKCNETGVQGGDKR